jgi:hypothetical protein
MKKLILLLLILALPLIIGNASAALINATLINVTSGQPFAVFYGPSVDAYIDSDTDVGNPDLALRVCTSGAGELQGKYATAVYKIGNTSSYVDIAWDATLNKLTAFDGSCDGSAICCTTLARFSLRDTLAVYPAYVFAAVSSDDTLSTSDDFIFVPQANGWLRGYYTVSTVWSTYNQTSGNVTLDVTAVDGYKTASATEPIYPSGAGKDVSYIITGICDLNASNILNYQCYSSRTIKPSDSAVQLFTGVTNPSNTNPAITKYYVVNGIGTSFCIGPDLQITSFAPNTSVAFTGQDVNFTVTLTNGYNVNIDTPFYVRFYYSNGTTISTQQVASLNKGLTTSRSVVVNTAELGGSGTKYINVSLDFNSTIGECNEGNNNGAASVYVGKVYFVDVWVDNVLSTSFARAGVPYNITIHVNDSDGNNAANALIRFVEYNDINLFAPTQIWNHSSNRRGLVSYSTAEVLTNGTGWVNFTIMPTGNKPLVIQNPDMANYVGNYSLYLELYVGGTKETIYSGGQLGNNLTFSLINHNTTMATGTKVVNNQALVQTITNAAYQIYASVLDWLT